MIIADLIRVGRPLLAGGLEPRTILAWLSDAESKTAKNFYQNVLVVELSSEKSEPEATCNLQRWGHGEGTDFVPDTGRGLSIPFSLPSGGNPIKPQGHYGIPSYPCYDKHLKGFATDANSVIEFLSGRVEKTVDFELSEKEMAAAARAVHSAALRQFAQDGDKKLGLLIIVRHAADDSEGIFELNSVPADDDLGASGLVQNAYIHSSDRIMTDHFLEARAREGVDAGQREGSCTLCTAENQGLIPPYCKTWPWLMLAWRCPFPDSGRKDRLIESVGLCPECYKALAVGAAALNKAARPLHGWLTREVFAPTADREAKDKVGRNVSNLPTVYGTAYLTPLLDTGVEDEEEFAVNVANMLRDSGRTDGEFKQQMDLVTGFNLVLPENSISEDYRLAFLYYSGQPSRGDIHLRAVVEDVLPPTLVKLHNLVKENIPHMKEILTLFRGDSRGKHYEITLRLHSSVPYLLANGYGPPYFWEQLQAVFHRQRLDVARAVRNCAHRMRSLSRQLTDSQTIFRMGDEVLCFLSFTSFALRYNRQIATTKENDSIMKSWQQLLAQSNSEKPLMENEFDTVADLGFAVGAVTSDFSFRYSGAKGKDKNYLTHRVMTFGSSLGWKDVWRRGLAQMQELELKLNPGRKTGKGHLFIPDGLRARIGILLCELENRQTEVEKHSDEFMCGFWAGYALKRAQGIRDAKDKKAADSEKNSKDTEPQS